MAACLTEDEYKSLITEITGGTARLSVSRALARQFFLRVGNRNVRDLTGQSVIGQKLVVFCLLAAAVSLVIACFFLLAGVYGFIALFAIPLVGIFWTVVAGFTTEYGTVTASTLVCGACLGATFLLPQAYQMPLAAFLLSVYCYRLAHIAAQMFLLQLLMTSFSAYDMLCEQIDVARDAG